MSELGGGLLTLGGVLSVIGSVMLNGGLLGPSFGPGLLTFLAWVSIFGDLVLGIVALAAARRHLVVVAVVAVSLNVINALGSVQPMLTILAHLVVACLLLALALSRRATRVLKIIAMAVLAVLLVYFISASPWGTFGDAHTLTVIWLLSGGAILAVVGWLVLIASIKTPGAPSGIARQVAKVRT